MVKNGTSSPRPSPPSEGGEGEDLRGRSGPHGGEGEDLRLRSAAHGGEGEDLRALESRVSQIKRRCGVLVLAGGQSRRMGTDKAWVPVRGQGLLARMVAMARELGAEEIFISGRAETDYSGLNCPVLLDREPGLGPLGGIERGLQAVRSPLLLVLAVDLPQMTVEFLRKLAGQCDELTGVVPKLNGEWEPLAAVYPKRCHATVCRLLQEQRRSARAFAAACFEEGAVREYTVLSAEAGCFLNCNTPADLPVS